MFDSFFQFNKVGKETPYSTTFLKNIWYYNFRSRKSLFIVEVEEYQHHIFVLKYYQKKHKKHPKKFQILSDEYKAATVIGTCIRIMLSIYHKNNKASFGFIGANSFNPESGEEEPINNTQRFRIYKYAMEELIGTESFTHGMEEDSSSYIMISNKCDVHFIASEAKRMFTELYPSFSGRNGD